MEQATSKYFCEGFDLYKKKVDHLHPELGIQDLQIDPKLVDKEKEEEEEKKDKGD